MGFFPSFIKITNKKVLVVGGGKVAKEKIEKLLDFTQDITIIADTISNDVKKISNTNNLQLENRKYKKGDVKNFFIVIVAVDNINLQKDIYNECQENKILCNSVDSVEYCDFIFPSYIKQDELIIAISTSGHSPAIAKYLKRYIKEVLPHNINNFLSELKSLRDNMKKGKERMELLDKKAKSFFKQYKM